ncbi:DNA polymerase III subunit delta [Patescibacteria group bacterium]|nr:DNA polymerase III subunit delta [Patescibacteria group bacterium]MBU4000156.1 DNA polymerase III subunit delta [Patescibacteria group bacterium]MBU4056976.1 DNA polymerase III subunit delta [Patescibacteria group bacterium]MBU4368869.1 DNA polymerase III subunit delta [Patescibacteria group bacterium]
MLYIIHGADSFRAREKLNEIIGEFRKKDSSGMNLSIFDADSEAEEFSPGKIKAASQAAGFLSPARMIVVKNLFGAGEAAAQKEIKDFIISYGKKGKTAADFIFFEPREIGKKNKEFLSLAKIAKVFHFELLSPALVQKWIADKLGKEKVKISPRAEQTLALFVGSDLWRMEQELEKLILFKNGDKGATTINENDIEALVKSDLPTNVFSTIDALARRDKKTALKLLAGHLERGEAPLYLLTMFVYQFRNLLKVKDVIAREKSASAPQIAETLKLHPYVVNKTVSQAKAFDLEYLKKVYKRFLRFDFLIKKGRLGAEAALEMIIIEVGNLI